MSRWGVLIRDGAADARCEPRVVGDLREGLDGLVEVDAAVDAAVAVPTDRPGRDGPGPDDPGPDAIGRAALELLPDGVTTVLLVDDRTLVELGPGTVLAFLDHLTPDVDVAMRAIPVTDALKRVAGDRVLGGIDREGLVAPALPQVVRRPGPTTGRRTRLVTDGGGSIVLATAA